MAADSGQNWMVSWRKGRITQFPSICTPDATQSSLEFSHSSR